MTPLGLVEWTLCKSSVQTNGILWFVFNTEGKEFRTPMFSLVAPALEILTCSAIWKVPKLSPFGVFMKGSLCTRDWLNHQTLVINLIFSYSLLSRDYGVELKVLAMPLSCD